MISAFWYSGGGADQGPASFKWAKPGLVASKLVDPMPRFQE